MAGGDARGGSLRSALYTLGSALLLFACWNLLQRGVQQQEVVVVATRALPPALPPPLPEPTRPGRIWPDRTIPPPTPPPPPPPSPPPTAQSKDKPVVRLFMHNWGVFAKWYGFVFPWEPNRDHCADEAEARPFRALILSNKQSRNLADGIVYDAYNPASLEGVISKAHHRRGQKTVAILHEPGAGAWFPHPRVDIEYTYRHGAEALFPWGCGLLMRQASEDPAVRYAGLPDPKTRTKGVAVLVSNCGALGRRERLEQLMKLVKIDSFGHCLHNTDQPARRPGEDWAVSKARLIADYRVLLAFENGVSDWYITEKVYAAYDANVVPVYWGGKGLHRLVPEKTFIDVNQHTIPELAQMLNRILTDDEYFLSFFHNRSFRLSPPLDYERACRYKVPGCSVFDRLWETRHQLSKLDA